MVIVNNKPKIISNKNGRLAMFQTFAEKIKNYIFSGQKMTIHSKKSD